MVYESFDEKETLAIGEEIGRQVKPGEIYALLGGLGVGKTVLTKGFARGLGISETVNSPTFTIFRIYEEGRIPLYHFDVYRIADPQEMDEIGYEDYFYGQGVCLVEWADLIAELMPENVKWITIEKDLSQGFSYRRIRIEDGNAFGRQL